jgi:hypothetical protein
MKNPIKAPKNRPWKQHLEKSTKRCCTGPLKTDKVRLWLESECNPAYVPNLDKVTKKSSKSTPKWSPKRAKTPPGGPRELKKHPYSENIQKPDASMRNKGP